jgi:hypothetical protein
MFPGFDIDDVPTQDLYTTLLERVCVSIDEARGKSALMHYQQEICVVRFLDDLDRACLAVHCISHSMTYDEAFWEVHSFVKFLRLYGRISSLLTME